VGGGGGGGRGGGGGGLGSGRGGCRLERRARRGLSAVRRREVGGSALAECLRTAGKCEREEDQKETREDPTRPGSARGISPGFFSSGCRLQHEFAGCPADNHFAQGFLPRPNPGQAIEYYRARTGGFKRTTFLTPPGVFRRWTPQKPKDRGKQDLPGGFPLFSAVTDVLQIGRDEASRLQSTSQPGVWRLEWTVKKS
jgi:hypothetical protein